MTPTHTQALVATVIPPPKLSGNKGVPPMNISKKGIAFSDANLANTFKAACPSCSWAYNWDSSAVLLTPNVNYVPMLWGISHLNGWDSHAQAAIANGAEALLSFNEPDNAEQANMSPIDAAILHNSYMNKYSTKALIGSPAVTNSDKPNEGIMWLKQFISACASLPGGCSIDFCAVHWYSDAQFADSLFRHLEAAYKVCGRPIWLTEYAAFGQDDKVMSFLETMIPRLDSLAYVHKYSYFMVSVNRLMSSSTSLSIIGQIYADT
ncbi:glycoside hydrolase [Trichoderma arundinaceum]|uniref:Glycoside hydrolase n=1 Tax=Trichoderma arundinaceum TaxID=490622 RepID=A0A395NZQ1_TRIAR|nr:glycoside hydrolase [Trichoderma arundinaceum]